MNNITAKRGEETAVDDVRRVRERLHREAAGDLAKHVERSNQTLSEYCEQLGLRIVPSPSLRKTSENVEE